MITSPVDDRAKAAGAVGLYLKRLLMNSVKEKIQKIPFAEQISLIYRSSWDGIPVTPLRRAAHSFLCADVPVQVPMSASYIWRLVDETCPVPELSLNSKKLSKWRWARDRAETLRRFPIKSNPAATNKVNLFFTEVASDMAAKDLLSLQIGLRYIEWVRERQVVYNDQATAVLLYGYCLSRYSPHGWRHAAASILKDDYAKGFSVFGKAVGINGNAEGAMLVESNTLLGRDVNPVDLLGEAKKRVDINEVRDSVVEYDDSQIREAVRRVLLREIKREDDSYLLDFPTLEDHWASRWAWAVNGAHSSLIYKRNPSLRTTLPGVDRVHRRAWLETVQDDPRPTWDGSTFVSASPKLELGKTRAIFACDTINYLAFEHLIATVEKNWRGERVILNPGKGGHLGMAQRVQAARNRSGISLMLDYDDFNSHHSNHTMKVIIEETCKITGYPPHLAERLVGSIDKQYIHIGGKYIGCSKGTLMSGHRLTTYINSVANQAYLDIELGAEILEKNVSLHVGDDVYLGVSNYREAQYVLERIRQSKLRMNPAKQSVGHVATEFLRVASQSRYSYGYLARCVGSLVNGNWVSELALAPLEALSTIIGSARSLANRSGLADVALLLVSSTRRMTGLGSRDDTQVRNLLTGRVALGNGPCYQSSGYYLHASASVNRGPADDHGYVALPLEATHTYLSTMATELEVTVLTKAGVSVEEGMMRASYTKSITRRPTTRDLLALGPTLRKPCVGIEWAEMVLRRPRVTGLLTQYPLLVLARSRLPESVVRDALELAGGDRNTPYLEYDAWGEYAHGCVIDTVMSYTDASALGSRTAAGVLTSVTRMYV